MHRAKVLGAAMGGYLRHRGSDRERAPLWAFAYGEQVPLVGDIGRHESVLGVEHRLELMVDIVELGGGTHLREACDQPADRRGRLGRGRARDGRVSRL